MSQAIDVLKKEIAKLNHYIACQGKDIATLKIAITSGVSGACCTFPADFLVRLGSEHVGGVVDGETIIGGTTSVNLLKEILTRREYPTYEAPDVTLIPTTSVHNLEIGEELSLVFNYTYDQDDAGAIEVLSLKKNSVEISAIMPYTDLVTTTTTLTYQLSLEYAEGPCKYDNLGDIDCIHNIDEGTILSNTVVYPVYRKAFYGTPSSTPTTSANVRALTGFSWNPQNNPTVDATGVDLVPTLIPDMTIVVPSGATRVVFAYPSTLRDVAAVRYSELANSQIKDLFTQTTVSVTGANGHSATNYKVYTFIPVEAFSQQVVYKVFI